MNLILRKKGISQLWDTEVQDGLFEDTVVPFRIYLDKNHITLTTTGAGC